MIVDEVLCLYDLFICVEKSLEGDQPQFATCRSLLRSGPAASLRVNIRAVSLGFMELLVTVMLLYCFKFDALSICLPTFQKDRVALCCVVTC